MKKICANEKCRKEFDVADRVAPNATEGAMSQVLYHSYSCKRQAANSRYYRKNRDKTIKRVTEYKKKKLMERGRKRSEPRYYAISHYRSIEDYRRDGSRFYRPDSFIITGPWPSRQEADDKAIEKIATDKYCQTLRINMLIVSKSQLKKHHIKEDEYNEGELTWRYQNESSDS